MPFTPQTLEEKPYNLCLNCAHIGKRCDGPNFLAMSTERWCEWCRLRKDYLGWTNKHVAELANVAEISVARVMSGNVKDLRISTMQNVTKVLVNGSWGQYPCAMAEIAGPETVYLDNPTLIEKADNAAAECQRLRAALDDLRAEHKERIAEVTATDQRKIDFLKEELKFRDEQLKEKDKLLAERYGFLRRKDRALVTLSILLAICLILIFTALIVDFMYHDRGFFWLAGIHSSLGDNFTGALNIITRLKK